MPGGSTDAAPLKDLHALFRVGAVGPLTDGQLLERFVAGRDGAAEVAFAALVERHGPMVLRVCRQVLGDADDAQDAFQATFLVLVRRAGAIRRRESVASWLHGVARRVARRALADAARRRAHERRAAEAASESSPPGDRPEPWAELHEEIGRLPEAYRAPVVLCYLEGLSTGAAAQRLGCPQGTVLSRLSRARDRLRERLARRGLAPSAGLLLAGRSPIAPPPAALIAATVRASLGFATRQATTTALASARAVALARGVLHAMTISKLSVLGASMLAGVLALGGLRAAAQFGGIGAAPSSTPPEAQVDDRPTALMRTVDRLQAELEEAERRNAAMLKELQDLRAELVKLKANPAAHPPAAEKAAPPKQIMRGRTIPPALANRGLGAMPGMFAGRGGMPGMDGMGGGPDQPQYLRSGAFIYAVAPLGDKAVVYNSQTGESHGLRLSAPKDEPLVVIPIVGPNVAALDVKGPKITRIAASVDGLWYPQDLREPVDGEAMPIVGPGVVAYGIGRYIYAFGAHSKRWDVAELPEGTSAVPIVGPNAVTVQAAGHLYDFNAQTGKWHHIDINSILDATEDRKEGGAEPEK